MANNTCGKCNEVLFDKNVNCFLCCRGFHKRCAKLDDTAMRIIESNSSVSWRCPACTVVPYKPLIEKISSLSSEIASLKSEFLRCISNAKGPLTPLSANRRSASTSILPSESEKKRNTSKAHTVLSKHGSSKASINVPKRSTAKDSGATASGEGEKLLTPGVASDKPAHDHIVTANNTCFAALDSSADAPSYADAVTLPPVIHTENHTVCHRLDEGNANLTSIALENNNNNTSGWNTVKTNKRGKIIGTAAPANNFVVVSNTKWIHLSRFHPSTTTDSITNFIANNFNIEISLIKCKALVKNDADIASLKFIHFKLGVPANFVDSMLIPSAWPSGLHVRLFTHMPKNVKVSTAFQEMK